MKMDWLQLIQELKQMPDREAQRYAASYGVHLTVDEIRRLRPLLDEISIHWLFTGIPPSFVNRVAEIIGYERTKMYMEEYLK